MIGSRAWFALMRRNWIYRRRHWISSIFELVLPFCFVWILVAIKNASNFDDIEANPIRKEIRPDTALIPFSYTDYMRAFRVQRVCVPGRFVDWDISGLPDDGMNWQVPFIKCNSQRCQYAGQDAQPFCEYNILVVTGARPDDAGGQARALQFRDWMWERWPILTSNRTQASTNQTVGTLPFAYDFVQIVTDPTVVDEYISRSDYGTVNVPKIGMSIVFDGNSSTAYKYWLRPNSTNLNAPERAKEGRPVSPSTPATNRLFNSFARSDVETCTRMPGDPYLGRYQASCTGQYLYNGVLSTQRLVDDFILADAGAEAAGFFVSEGGVQYVQFPQKAYIQSGFFQTVENSAPLIIALGLLYPVAAMITYIVREKELRQKELMKMMSVMESDIGWAWFCTFAIWHLVSASCAAAVSAVLYDRSSLFLLWLFWTFGLLSMIVFSMAWSTITSRSARAVLVGLLVFFSGIFLTLAVDYESGNPTAIAFVSLHPVTAFVYGINILGQLEDLNLGLVRNTVDYTESLSGLRMIDVYRYLVVDTFLWSFLSWYLNRVVEPEYGQALPLWFPFTPSYWGGILFPGNGSLSEESPSTSTAAEIPLEPVSDALKRQAEQGKSIEIVNLRKTYGDTVAVDAVNLSIYSGQVTALLGHNGAGKTTTIAMLTGAIGPTSGYATVAGKDIRTHMLDIRQNVGICLQHDCLFPHLTVREHVQFFARIKGLYSKLSYDEAEKQIDQSIRDVALFEKSNTFSRNLSGGMKRKLSVALACCGSDIVFLDEPTSGMDPFSRRFTWNVIRNYKKDRIIILTTHFMDEADILGDRIAIMAEGQIRCVGSSLFLKKAYGVGYQLTIEKVHETAHRALDERESTKADNRADIESLVESPTSHVNNNINDLKCIVTDSVSEATLLSEVGSELRFELPLSSSSAFAPMLSKLDAQVDDGVIACYGVSITTLNEVFHLVTRGENPVKSSPPSVRSIGSGSARSAEFPEDVDNSVLNEGEAKHDSKDAALEHDDLFLRHVVALMKKRGSYFRRDKKAWVCTTIVPSLFVLLGFLFYTYSAPGRVLAALTLDIRDYNIDHESSVIPFNSPNNPFLCQPGTCSHLEPLSIEELPNETYVFCGLEAKLGISLEGFTPDNSTCSVLDSGNIVAQISANSAIPNEAPVGNILEGSGHLLDISGSFASSLYGALWFTHLQDSVMDDGRLYRDTVVEQCKVASQFLNYTSDCSRFGGVGYVVQYNFTALHSALLFEMLATEGIVKYATKNQDIVVETTIAPLPITIVESRLGEAEDAFLIWFLVVISFPFIGGAFGSFVVQERSSKSKHLQTVAGVKPSAYWLSTYLWDTINYQIPLWAVVAQMFLFDISILTTSSRGIFPGIVAILFLFGPALAGFVYVFSFCFKSASMCNVFAIASGFLIGMGGPLTCIVLELLARDPRNPNPNLSFVATIITWVLRCTPSFCLGKGLFYAINIELFQFLEGEESLSAWSEPILLYEVYFLVGQCIVYVWLAIQLDRWSTNPSAMAMWRQFISCVTLECFAPKTGAFNSASPSEDEDVVKEADLVLSRKSTNDMIVIKKLTKIYDDGKVAVDSLSLGIAPGECFGLLGINGAGKTTTMGLLTAEFPPTSGDAILGGFSIMHEPQRIRRLVGYCPQFDALYSCLTAREHLLLYGAVKGISNAYLTEAVTKKLIEVGLKPADWDRVCSGFSGGMKRRLSLACATMGQPKLIFLDECSTGVDPVSRREIWQLVSGMVAGHGLAPKDRPSVILTTHSMDECEALCPRIGIMANGRLRCLGSAQHLKNKFGKGYQVELNLKLIQPDDEDYLDIANKLNQVSSPRDWHGFNMSQCIDALSSLTGDDSLSSLISVDNSSGYLIWKDAMSPMGVSFEDLAAFAVSEHRMHKVNDFVSHSFPGNVLRERQDMKVRYEVSGLGLRISEIFATIEENKRFLRLADYGVSQTSLEQVFNMHAAEAESLKALPISSSSM